MKFKILKEMFIAMSMGKKAISAAILAASVLAMGVGVASVSEDTSAVYAEAVASMEAETEAAMAAVAAVNELSAVGAAQSKEEQIAAAREAKLIEVAEARDGARAKEAEKIAARKTEEPSPSPSPSETPTPEASASAAPAASGSPAPSASPTAEASAKPADNSVKGGSYPTHKNPGNHKDVYSWISVPGTLVDYPVYYSSTLDYWLTRNVDSSGTVHNPSNHLPGSIYVNGGGINSKDYSDYLTIMYGHNMKRSDNNINAGITMFGTLHYFDDSKFFNSHDTIYIDTDTKRLTYKIIACVKYTAYRVDSMYDVRSKSGRDAYWKELMGYKNNDSRNHVRDGASVSGDDKLLILSVCINDENHRYHVVGKLVSTTNL